MIAANPGAMLDPGARWVKKVSAHFERGVVSRLPHRIGTMFVCRKHKVLYMPIAKCACSSLKRLMVDLSELPHPDVIFKYGVHRTTDSFITGAKLKDYDIETVREILEGDYYTFAVIRNPVSRIISAYTEKFLLNRRDQGNLVHTLDVLRTVRNTSSPDVAQGISFREFVDYLVDEAPENLDTHWMPQHLYLPGAGVYDDIFTMEQLDLLSQRLTERVGRQVSVGKHNVSVDKESESGALEPGRLVDVLPADIDDKFQISTNDFMAPDLCAKLADYYHEDLSLYNRASQGLSGYDSGAAKIGVAIRKKHDVISSASKLAKSVSLFSKGYFGADEDGRGFLQVLVLNKSAAALDFSRVEACSLSYIARDKDGEVVFSSDLQPVQLTRIEAESVESVNLDIEIPGLSSHPGLSLTVSLHFGEQFKVGDVAPFHITAATYIKA